MLPDMTAKPYYLSITKQNMSYIPVVSRGARSGKVPCPGGGPHSYTGVPLSRPILTSAAMALERDRLIILIARGHYTFMV